MADDNTNVDLQNDQPAGEAGPSSIKPGILQRFIQFPITRIIIALIFVLGALGIANAIQRFLVDMLGISGTTMDSPLIRILRAFIVVLITHFAYSAYVRIVEKRAVSELGLNGFGKELMTGIFWGALLMSATIGIMWMLGNYTVTGINSITVLGPILAISIVAGYVEEVIIRGIIFRIVEEGLGSWIAVAISGGLFGYLHASNPNATIISSLAIALEAGILLAAVFMFTRRLWLAIGLHFSWNFTQGGIWGVAVSGLEFEGVLNSELSGPEILSGGAFGAEASIIAMIICTSAGVYFLWKAHQAGQFIEPFWKRKTEPDAAVETADQA